jgi:hypothetical protein
MQLTAGHGLALSKPWSIDLTRYALEGARRELGEKNPHVRARRVLALGAVAKLVSRRDVTKRRDSSRPIVENLVTRAQLRPRLGWARKWGRLVPGVPRLNMWNN